ncbi:MAG: hypothetical protein LUD02_09245 [Tannerellaceae bacterium]|nr:hypothetical protein [Tannerellaceae bacterium]
MGTFIAYIIQSALFLLVFYLFYSLVLSKETFHRINRFGLLGLIGLSAVLPFIKPSFFAAPTVPNALVNLPDVKYIEPIQPLAENNTDWIWVVLLASYLAGVVFFF